MKINYKKRIVDQIIEKKLLAFGAVVIEGAKLTGKSTTATQFAKTIIEFQNPELKEYYKTQVSNNPTSLFTGEKPILFDEWQDNYPIWDAIRYDVDKTGKKGQYILTGSKNTEKDKVMHSGTGRFDIVKMYPMSLYESGDSNGEISLQALFNSDAPISASCDITVDIIIELIIRGGFPNVLSVDLNIASEIMRGYYNSLVTEKIITIDGIKRDPSKMNSLLKSYSRNISTYASDATILGDMEKEGIEISEKTFSDYKNTLEKLYIIDNIPSWPTSIRSKSSIRKSDKKLLLDPSIACAALGLSKEMLIKDFRYLGFLFESLCLRDLRIYIESIDGKVYHYREEKDFEIDAVLELRNGSWGAVEIKLGADEETLQGAANSLLKLKDKINTDLKGNPSFLMILYGGRYAYKREDGVFVVPIGCLKN